MFLRRVLFVKHLHYVIECQSKEWLIGLVLYLNSSPSSQPRTQSGSSPELVSLETPTNIINISSSHPQEALDLNSKLSSLCPPSVPQNSSADTYDKQAINNMFDSLLSQKWPTETAFPEATTEVSLQL